MAYKLGDAEKRYKRMVRAVGLSLAVGISLYIPFSNPEMTNTQLFLNYWWLYLTAIVCLLISIKQ